MTPEERVLLQELAEKVEENNDILKSIRRSMRISRIFSFIYWAIIIGSAIGAYYLIQPYIDQLLSVYSGASNDLNSAKELLNSLR
jgi:hypothetical protein